MRRPLLLLRSGIDNTGVCVEDVGRRAVAIEEIEEAIKGLLTKDAPSGIYHMGDDEALSTNELIEVICSALGMKQMPVRAKEGLRETIKSFAK